MNKRITDIYDSVQEIAWRFGSHGVNGECCDNLSFVEFMALKKVHGCHDLTVREIGDALNFTKSGATRIVDRLEKKGYVTRKISRIDGRVCCVSSTVKGNEAIAKIETKYAIYLKAVLEELEPQKVARIHEALLTLAQALRKKRPLNTDPTSAL